MAAGGISVLFLGVLNRIMRVELGIDLMVVGLLIGAGHYVGALAAIPFGYYSDSHRVAGYRRTVYILFGALISCIVLLASPWIAHSLSIVSTSMNVLLAFAFFMLEGISTFVAGTAYLALIADRTTRDERGQATGLVWALMMVGIIFTGIGAAVFMGEYSFERLVTLFAIGFVVAMSLAVVALWGQETRVGGLLSHREGGLRDALRMVALSRQARRFAAFLMVGMFSYFMQDVILEPFGGEVFNLPPAHTTRFNAYMGVGVICGMLLGGVHLIPRRGKRWVTGLGCWIMILAFSGLGASAFLHNSRWLSIVIALLGLGSGFFTVGGVALMMDMTASRHTGLFVGAWTLVQALAKGPASVVAGGLQGAFLAGGVLPGQAYGAVFVLEAAGLIVAIILLRRVEVQSFHLEVGSLGTVVEASTG